MVPRLKLPFPDVRQFGCHATRSNVKIVFVPPTMICRSGSSWFASFGSGVIGAQGFSASAVRSTVRTSPKSGMSIPLQDLIKNHAGIVRDVWNNLLGISGWSSVRAIRGPRGL